MSDPKLKQLTTDENFRGKVEALLSDLEAKGFDAKIGQGLRTKEQQAAIVAAGNSQTQNSFHLGKWAKDGKASAADIICQTHGWNLTKREQLLIGSSAWAHGLGWGGLFGARSITAIKEAILKLRKAGWPETHPAYAVSLGWDEYHVTRGKREYLWERA